MQPRNRLPIAILALLLAGGGRAAYAQAPAVNAIHPAGVQAGATQTVHFLGGNLQGATQVLVSGDDRVRATVKDASNGGNVAVEVTVAPDAAPGPREMRLVTSRGISASRYVWVGYLPIVPESEANNTPAQANPIAQMPVQIAGQINGGEDVDCFSFEVQGGETLVFDLNAARHYSALDATIVLRDATGRELAVAMEGYGRDPRIVHTFASPGKYTLLVRDTRYQGGANFTYLLNVGALPIVTGYLPLGGRRGEKVALQVQGYNLGGATQLEVSLPNDPERDQVLVAPETPAGRVCVPLCLYLSDLPEIAEAEPNQEAANATALPAVPSIASGRLEKPGDVDRFAFSAQQGQVIAIEVLARRIGSRLDPVLRVLDGQGKELANNDDAIGLDSRVVFTAPAAGTFYAEVFARDGLGSLEHTYRLVLSVGNPPDFTLTYNPDIANVPQGGAVILNVDVQRRNGFGGDVRLRAEGLPPGMTMSRGLIRAGQNSAVVTLRCPPDAAIGFAAWRLIGEATIDGRTVTRIATPGNNVQKPLSDANQVVFRPAELALAAVAERQGFALTLPVSEVTLQPGQSVTLKVQAIRNMGFNAGINLAINGLPNGVTAQLKNIAQDQNEVEITITAANNAPAVDFQNAVLTGTANNITQAAPAITVIVRPKQ